MSFQDLSDEELLQLVQDTRQKIVSYEDQLNHTDNSVDKAAMRSEMTRLNHLKVEANRRGLNAQ